VDELVVQQRVEQQHCVQQQLEAAPTRFTTNPWTNSTFGGFGHRNGLNGGFNGGFNGWNTPWNSNTFNGFHGWEWLQRFPRRTRSSMAGNTPWDRQRGSTAEITSRTSTAGKTPWTNTWSSTRVGTTPRGSNTAWNWFNAWSQFAAT
jgi:hypothetical protein